MMDKWHYLVFLVLNSITFCLCMPNGQTDGQSDDAIGLLGDFSEEHMINMVQYLSGKKQFQTVLDILPDIHRKYPGNETLYIIGGTTTWRRDHPSSEGFHVILPNEASIVNNYVLQFLEKLIISEDYDTAVTTLEVLVGRLSSRQARGAPPSSEMMDRINAIRDKIQKWIEEEAQVVPTNPLQ